MDVILHDFSLEQIASSGQCFRIFKGDNSTWSVYHQNHHLNIKQMSEKHYNVDCSDEEWRNVWHNYFNLDTNYSKIKQIIFSSGDLYLQKAIKFGSGIRILRQDLLETIISFIISQNNNIQRITKTINLFCAPYFPNISSLATLSINEWQSLGTGYRATYLYEAVQKIYDGTFDLDKLKMIDYKPAVDYLKTLKGIGNKVANCIALFGLHHMNAFPQDVWINRIIQAHYKGQFSYDKYKNHLGIIQQYMFYYARFCHN